MKKNLLLKVCVIGILLISWQTHLFAQQRGNSANSLIQQGIQAFQQSRFDDAAEIFISITENDQYSEKHGDGYFWTSKSLMAMGNLDQASQNLEYFIHSYPNHPLQLEAQYQRGKLLYLQGDFEEAVQALADFVDEHPSSPFVANALYWSAEALFNNGHYDQAENLYRQIIQEYPASYRLEPARYRLAVLELQRREDTLLELLRSSHQELIFTIQNYQRREQELMDSIAEYRRRIQNTASGDIQDEIEDLQSTIEQLQNENEDLRARNSELQDTLQLLRDNL